MVLTGCNSNYEKMKTLTEEELAYFNGTEFFNCYENRSNQFLSSLYDSPEKIDLYELLYCTTGDVELTTDAEIAAIYKKTGRDTDEELPCACEKMTTAKIDAFLQRYIGLTLAETEKIGLEHFIYLEEYDAYYHIHGDTNFRSVVTFHQGEQQGDLIRLYYKDDFLNEGEKVVTLRQQDEGYYFIANQKVDTV